MPSTDRKLELKADTSVAQTASQAAVYAKGLTSALHGVDDQRHAPAALPPERPGTHYTGWVDLRAGLDG
jgi:hypothetical protein